MNASTRNTMVDLALDLHLGNVTLVPQDNRAFFISYLTLVLVNKPARKQHKDLLTHLNVKDAPNPQPDTVLTALQEGLERLNNRELASLALHIDTLNNLAVDIDQTSPEPWHRAIKAEGRRPETMSS